MKTELQNKLVERYPEFFEYLKEYKGPLMPIAFGFECGDGWYEILDALMDGIHNKIKTSIEFPDKEIKSKFWRWVFNGLERKLRRKSYKWKKVWKTTQRFKKMFKTVNSKPLQVNLTQVKEKFGGLRFYFDTSGGRNRDSWEIDGMVRLAENLSYRTCEFCGSTKNVGMTKGWLTVCCKECFDSGKVNSKNWEPNIE